MTTPSRAKTNAVPTSEAGWSHARATLLRQAERILPSADLSVHAQALLEAFASALGAHRASLMLLRRDSGRLFVVAGIDLPEGLVGNEITPRPRSISDWVLRERRGVVLQGEVRDARFEGSAEAALESTLCMPLLSPRGVLAIVNLARRSPAPAFTEADLEQIEQCLAPLRDGLERLEHAAMAEETQARLIETMRLPGRTLIPEGAFETPHWEVALARRSAAQPGGVLCDRAPHANGVTTFLMLDVTRDAGLPEVTAAFLHGVFVGAAHPDRAASGIAAQLAAALQGRGGNERWVAFWLVQAERHGEVTSCSAGFRGALWVPADGGALVQLARGGPEAGAPAMPRYEEETFRLLPGDVLVAASEGLLNARNASGRPFGPERLREVVEESRRLPIERLCAAVCDAAALHSGQSTPAEDTMVLALHYRESD